MLGKAIRVPGACGLPGVILIALTGVAGIVDVDVCDRNSESSFSRFCSLCVPIMFLKGLLFVTPRLRSEF